MTPIVTLFNNKGGVGKTSLVYHLAWMLAELGTSVLTVDLDPQANLTAAFIDEDDLERLWPEGDHPETIDGVLQPLAKGTGDILLPPPTEKVTDNIRLLPGDLALGRYEDELSAQWPACLDGNERAFRVITAFWRAISAAAAANHSDLVLVDVGPNLGAINRAALVASDRIVIPLAPDLFSLQGLQNLGPTLRAWREQWRKRLDDAPSGLDFNLPEGQMQALGYVVLQHSVRLDRPVKAFDLWIRRIPGSFRKYVLDEIVADPPAVADDPWCLGTIKHYHSLIPMAQEARKPLFLLKPADGAIGAHQRSVQLAYRNFQDLATEILQRLGSPGAHEHRGTAPS